MSVSKQYTIVSPLVVKTHAFLEATTHFIAIACALLSSPTSFSAYIHMRKSIKYGVDRLITVFFTKLIEEDVSPVSSIQTLIRR